MSEEKQQRSGFWANFDWNKTVKRLIVIITIGFLGNLLFSYFLSDSIGFDKLLEFNPLWLLLAFVGAIFPWIGHAWEIQTWASFFKKKMTFKKALKISVATDLGSAITPTMVGGAPVKLGMLMRRGLTSAEAAAMVTLTAIEDFVFIAIMIPIAIYFSDNIGISVLDGAFTDLPSKLPYILAFLAGVVVVSVIFYKILKQFDFVQKVKKFVVDTIKDFVNVFGMIAKDGKLAFLMSVLFIGSRWVSRFLIVIFLVKGLDLALDYKELFLSQWMIYAGMTVTPTPGAMGGAEGLFYFVFKDLIPQDFMGIIVTTWRFFTYYLILLLAVLYINATLTKKDKALKD